MACNDVPTHVLGRERKRWLRVFNASFARAVKGGRSTKDAVANADANACAANGHTMITGEIADINALLKFGSASTGFVVGTHGPFRCGRCAHYDAAGHCLEPDVIKDTEVPKDDEGRAVVSAADCCNEWTPAKEAAQKMAGKTFQKFIPFVKVDNSIDPSTGQPRREVWGIVTAELPDKDEEVCDYEGSKPFYQAVIAEMSKATDGRNFFPLREMHGLSAAGKGIGFEFRDDEKEIFMGFKVVDDDAWKKCDEGVYTGFSQGGRIVGDLTPDPVYKGCMRYVANPSEVSLVDNPCLGAAHFAYVKADGSMELRKLRSVQPPTPGRPALVKNETGGKPKLKPEQFAYTPDLNQPTGWRLRVDDAARVRKSLYEFNRVEIPTPARPAVYAKIAERAKELGIDIPAEQKLLRATVGVVRKRARTWVNKRFTKLGAVPLFANLDSELGKLQKGMYQVSALAQSLENLAYVFYSVVCEQEYEHDDDSPLPEMLQENINGLTDTMLALVAEEAAELKQEVASRAAGASAAAAIG